jgi:acetoin utilization deacetylase AcuC-like enzyme
MQRLIVPAAQSFKPEVILVSCGFDAHRDDPLASMQVSREGFQAMTAIIRSLAEDLCGGRLAFVLEGGYAASGLLDGAGALLEGIIAPKCPELHETAPILAGSVLEHVLDSVLSIHGQRFSSIAAS